MTKVDAADLSVGKVDALDPVTVGDDVTYTVTVANAGPDTALAVTLTDTLPVGVIFGSATGGCSEAGGVVSCDLGSVAAGGSASVTIVVTSTAAGVLTNTASVGSATADPDGGNNATSEDTTVEAPPAADLSVTKLDALDPVTVGDDVTYTVTVANAGPDTALAVTLTDTLPVGV
ncbi:MAG: DUF11 domain-containing protein, partial [Ketobacter sp.]|nr:DUF11 domain-containing protein [Ketobacter sp.]